MEILNIPRGFGKTTNIIVRSIETGYPIIVNNEMEKRRIKRVAESAFRRDVTVFTIEEFRDNDIWGYLGKPKKVLIDELPNVLRFLLESDCEMATMTSESLQDYDIKKFEKRLGN